METELKRHGGQVGEVDLAATDEIWNAEKKKASSSREQSRDPAAEA